MAMTSLLTQAGKVASRYFAGWVLIAGLAGLAVPDAFTWVLPHVPLLLGVIMFGMGLTLTGNDFRAVFTRPWDVVAGAVAQFTIMPVGAYALARAFHLPPEIAVGVVLVGCAPGGTASNVITWFAKGDVALSVTMTSVSTLLSPVVTPLLVLGLAGRWVPVAAGAMFWSVVKVILLPVVLGLLALRFFARAVERSADALPVLSVLGITLIIAGVVGANAQRILASASGIFAAVILLNLVGYLLGYGAGAMIRMTEPKRRALSIEVGMQNSGLAVTLALAHFTPAAALAGALFSVWQNLSGAALANWWARRRFEPPAVTPAAGP